MLLVRVNNQIYNLADVVSATLSHPGDPWPPQAPRCEQGTTDVHRLRVHYKSGRSVAFSGDTAIGLMCVLCEECKAQFGPDVSLMSDTMARIA